MRSRHLAHAERLDGHPLRTPSSELLYLSLKRQCRAAGGVKLVNMVRLGDGDLIVFPTPHQLGQPLVEGEHDVHADTEVRRREEGVTTREALGLKGLILCVPARGTTHHRQPQLPAVAYVVHRRGRRAELDGHIGLAGRRPPTTLIDGARHRVAALQRQLLDGMPHLAVAYDGQLHFLINLKSLPR